MWYCGINKSAVLLLYAHTHVYALSHIDINTCNLHTNARACAYTHTHSTHTLPSGETAKDVTVSSSYKHYRKHNHCISLLPNAMLLDQFHNSLLSHLLNMIVPRDLTRTQLYHLLKTSLLTSYSLQCRVSSFSISS